jgi:hypothetical protein
MDPKFQTSFIPKSPVISQQKQASVSMPAIDIFSTVSTVVFFLTLILLGGAFGYEFYLKNQIELVKAEVVKANESYQLQDAKNIIAANSRLMSIKRLVDRHIAMSEMFSLLQTLTLKKVAFSNFSYKSIGGENEITMDTEAQTYNALAQQLAAFSENSYIKKPRFTDFALSENGNIKTKFTAVIDPSLVSYKKAVEALSQNQ